MSATTIIERPSTAVAKDLKRVRDTISTHRADLAAIPETEHDLEEREAQGEQVGQERSERRVRRRKLLAAIPKLERQVVDLVEEEIAAGAREGAERLRRAIEAAEQARDMVGARVDEAVDVLARELGESWRCNTHVAELKSGGNRERFREILMRDSGTGAVEVVGATLAGWLAHDPAARLDLDVLDRLTDPHASLRRRLRDAFFGRPS